MRLLLTADTVGGVWQYSLELARALAAHDVDVHIAAMGPWPSAAQAAEAAAVPNLVLHARDYQLEWMQGAAADVAAAGAWLLELEDALRPDVVQVNGFAHAALPWRAPALLVAHSCVFTWWRAVHGGAAPAAPWAAYRDGVERGLRAARQVIAPSAALLAAMEREYGPIRRARVIANGRTLPNVPGAAREGLVFTAGRLWDEAKNVAVLREAAALAHWPVYAAGALEGPDGARLQPGALHTPGVLSGAAIQQWLARAAVYVSTALYEPFGLGVLEAAGAGCALVLSDIPTFRELWDGAALFVPPRDAAAVAAALDALVCDEARRERLAAAARARAVTFTPARMARDYHEVYSRLFSPDVKAAICA